MARPSLEEPEQPPLLRSAGSTAGMPLIIIITLLIGFLCVPSIFLDKEQEEAGAIHFPITNVHVGTRDPGIAGTFFPFSLFPENHSKTCNPLEKSLDHPS